MSRLTSHESLTTQLTTTTTTQCHEHHRVKQTNATTAAGLPRTDGKQRKCMSLQMSMCVGPTV